MAKRRRYFYCPGCGGRTYASVQEVQEFGTPLCFGTSTCRRRALGGKQPGTVLSEHMVAMEEITYAEYMAPYEAFRNASQ
jgi:hypothetical protein